MADEERVRAAYDTVAAAYDAQLRHELDGKPLDRALLSAFVELVGTGTIADVGCGPGHVTRHLADLHADLVGVDLSEQMIQIARTAFPDLQFRVASMLGLDDADASWVGAVALYSIIHLSPAERARAFVELARVVRPGGWLLVSFHVDSPDVASGEVSHLTHWFGEEVDVDVRFLDPHDVTADVDAAGFAVWSTTLREPHPDVEHPSRRCYLLAQRR